MILHIRHRGLRLYWEKGETRRLNPNWLDRINRILNALDHAQTPADMDFPGWQLHMLRGNHEGFYAVDVSGNWRIIFRFEGSDTTDVDLMDYH